MARTLIATLLLIATTAAHAADAKQPRIIVPRTLKSPVIDGKLSKTEWADAAQVALADGGQARLLNDGRFLFVAMVGKRMGIGSICTMNKGELNVLHASAGLGTAVYAQKEGKWMLTRPFTFTNRDTSNSQTGIKDRKKFLADEHWYANTHPNGTTEREFQIRLDGRTEIPLVLSFMSYVSASEFDLDAWPETVVDGCVELDLASGWTNQQYTFEPKTWGIAVIR
jgi:hypothetical protein